MKALNEQQQQQIAQAVQQAEQLTDGEIVPMLVKQSDDYPGARWRLALISALLFGFISYLFFADSDPAYILWAQIPGIYLGYWLSSFPVILNLFLHHSKVEEEVHQRALQAFFGHNIHHSQQRNGILIMVSLLEHRVEILADKGINELVDKDTWQSIINTLLSNIKSKDLTTAYCNAILRCAEILAEPFPATKDKPNELSNSLIIED